MAKETFFAWLAEGAGSTKVWYLICGEEQPLIANSSTSTETYDSNFISVYLGMN
ncbi:hypothetical protein KKH3_14080 [Pectobacterium actinidiae]|nr:hypothetical protein KKH3_14080 [Pectobacterium actinidiae]